MTLLGTIVTNATTTNECLALFGLVNPTTGAKKFAWTFPGQSTAVNSYHFAVSFTGTETSSVAAATTGYATNSAASGASATVTSGASIASGAMAVAAYNNINGYSNAFTAGTNPGDGGTAVGKNESLTTNMAGEYYSGGGGAVNASATQGASGAFVAAIVGILPPGGGGGGSVIITPQLRTIIGRLKPQPFKPALLPPQGNPGTPTFVQAVGSTLNDNNGIPGNNFQFNMPNMSQAGNCLILAIAYPYNAAHAITVTDSAGDTWGAPAVVAGTASSGNENISIYVLPNASGAMHTLTVGGFASSIKTFRYTLSEFYNVASVNPVDGTKSAASVSGSSANAGSFTPPTNNDALGGHLIYQESISNDTVGTVAASQASAITTTNSAQLIHADNNCTIPSASAYFVQAANGSVNPGFAFTQSTPTNFVVAAIALLAKAAGSAPPAGIYIKRILHVSVVNPVLGNNAVLFPCDGNLRVATMAAGDNLNLVNSVKDSNNSTGYTDRTNASGESRVFESANTSANNANVITLNLATPDPQFSLHLLDITGADPSPFMNKSGFNGSAPATGATVFNDFPDHTPNANVTGLTIVQTGMGTAGPQFGFASGAPSGAVFDNVYYTGMTDQDRMDNADPFGHANFATNTAQTWNWKFDTSGGNGAGGSTAFATAVSYKAASAGTSVTVDFGGLLEFTSGVRSDGLVLLEYLASIRADSIMQLEALAAIRADSVIQDEILAGLRADTASRLEFLGSVRSDDLAPLEMAAALRSDVIALMEVQAGQRLDMIAASEILAGLRADLVGQLEVTSAFRSEALATIEATAASRSDVSVSEEILAGVAPQSGIQIEDVAGLQSNTAVPIENQGAIAVTGNATVQLDAIAKLNFDQLAAIEVISNVRRDAGEGTEILAGLAGQDTGQAEFVAGRQADIAAPTEFAGAIGVTGNASTPIEVTAAARADAISQVEDTAAVRGQPPFGVEVTAAAAAQSAARLESLAKTQGDIAVNDEIKGGVGVTASAAMPIEITGRLAAFGAAAVEIVQVFVSGVLRLLNIHGGMPPSEFGADATPGSKPPTLSATDGSSPTPPVYRKLTDKGALEE